MLIWLVTLFFLYLTLKHSAYSVRWQLHLFHSPVEIFCDATALTLFLPSFRLLVALWNNISLLHSLVFWLKSQVIQPFVESFSRFYCHIYSSYLLDIFRTGLCTWIWCISNSDKDRLWPDTCQVDSWRINEIKNRLDAPDTVGIHCCVIEFKYFLLGWVSPCQIRRNI